MVGIVIASHGELAPGIKQAGSMVFGDQPNVGAVSLMPSMGPDDIRAKIEECISSFDDQDQVLILADLWGGTPFNQASAVLDGHEDSWAIVTGLNLPMLIEVLMMRGELSYSELSDLACEVGKTGVTRMDRALLAAE